MRRNRWKERARITASAAAIAVASNDSFATVMEFDESGAMTTRPAINYLQRARLATRESAHPAGDPRHRTNEHIVNDNASSVDPLAPASREAAPAVFSASLPDNSDIPVTATTFVDVTEQPRAPKSWQAEATEIAVAHIIPPALFTALIEAESGFDTDAVSTKGAIGLTQLMPATAKSLGVDPHDPLENLTGGARYLRQQYERFGTWKLALAAYNAGPTRVARLGRIPNIAETKAFVARVMRESGLNPSPITTASN